MAAEDVDRCYHSVALLLPDGRVLSAGGGEYAPGNPALPNQPNPPGDSHSDAQVLTPPYLLKGPRPVIASAPIEMAYGKSFDITVGANDDIAKVSWIRLGSVTHSCNQNQLLTFLTFTQTATKLTIQAPANANVAPPGHYMLFVLNKEGVPSIAHVAHISTQAPALAVHDAAFAMFRPTKAQTVDLVAMDKQIAGAHPEPPVVVGISPSCPYGIGACWGGAFDALQQLTGIAEVRPLPDTADSTAFVYLKDDVLPEIDAWRDQFADVANGSYVMRGIEMTVAGEVTDHFGLLTLAGNKTRPDLVLAPLQGPDKIQWDFTTRSNQPVTAEEAGAYTRLSAKLEAQSSGTQVQVTGPLKRDGSEFFLEVREFKV
jgi:hypothetical protein